MPTPYLELVGFHYCKSQCTVIVIETLFLIVTDCVASADKSCPPLIAIDLSSLRKELKQVRLEAELSVEEVADRLGMSKRNWERYEAGEIQTIDLGLFDRFAEVCGKHLFDLLAKEGIIIGTG